MEKTERYTLGKDERLKSRKLIDQLFKEGKSFSIFPFRVLFIQTTTPLQTVSEENDNSLSPVLQAGFAVSSRHFKKAVHRNRVKRLMRETWRLQKNELHTQLAGEHSVLQLFLIYQGKDLPDFAWLKEKMSTVLKKLIKLTSENR